MLRRVGFGSGVIVGAGVALAGMVLLQGGGAAYAQSPGSKVLLDNERVNVVRAITQPGQVEKPHQHKPDENYVSIQLTPGDLEVTVGDQPTIHGGQGNVYWLPSTLTHTVKRPPRFRSVPGRRTTPGTARRGPGTSSAPAETPRRSRGMVLPGSGHRR
jgi:quercetin dioxygenase-like cupin family protein